MIPSGTVRLKRFVTDEGFPRGECGRSNVAISGLWP